MVEKTAASAGRPVSFGPFRLFPKQQLLLEDEAPVRLGSRALEILTALVERPGAVVGKNELITRVWPNTFIDENTLRVHVAGLRKALGDGQPGRRYLASVPGRGYRFVAPIAPSAPEVPSVRREAEAEHAHNLPILSARALGRAKTFDTLHGLISKQRLVTIVGAGGIGKTTVAVALAESLLSSYEHGITFVDLAPLGEPKLVPSSVASALKLAIHSESVVPALLAFLRDKQMLVVLDNCEHVIETTAALAEQILARAPGVRILATSREPLRADGERVHRLQPLESPSHSPDVSAADALEFPAIQLFVERVAAIRDGFELTDAEAPIVADICRKLNGIALAIELAAARTDAFGIQQLAVLLDDRFRILNQGKRTAQAHHRSLAAMLDWSYDFLPEAERVILRRLSVFAGAFTLESAVAVAGDIRTDVIDGLGNLVAKSLVSADIGGLAVQYRLLDTTRFYAARKLAEAGELEAYSRRHAEHHRDIVERAEAELATRSGAEWAEDYARRLDDIRSALKWAFLPNGDASVGIALTAASGPLWLAWCLPNEGKQYVERALASLPAQPTSLERSEMKLRAALADQLQYTIGLAPELDALWTRVIELAEKLGDLEFLLSALWRASGQRVDRGEYREALVLAERASAIADRNGVMSACLIGDGLAGTALHYLGERADALGRLRPIVERDVPPTEPFLFFYRALVEGTFAVALWVEGLPDQALRHAKSALEAATATRSALVVCTVLQGPQCLTGYLVGDFALVEHGATMLLERANEHGLAHSNALGRCWKGTLQLARGDVGGLALARPALAWLRDGGYAFPYLAFLGPLALGLAAIGQIPEARAAIDDALAYAERIQEHWIRPELLRVKGEILRLDGTAEEPAEGWIQQALDYARRQRALSWELRAATSLAQLWQRGGKIAEATELLSSVYNRFTEGFDTADLRTARTLIQELARPGRGAVR